MNDAAQSPTGSTLREVARAIGISISVNLSENHAITMQTHGDVADSAEELDAIIDKLTGRADRLISHYRLIALRKNLKLNELQLKHMVEDVARIDARYRAAFEVQQKSGRRGEFKLNNQQQAERDNHMVTKKRFEEEVARLKAEIEQCETEAK